jgi:hypothetical protein
MTCGARAIAVADIEDTVDMFRHRRMTARTRGLHVTRGRVAMTASTRCLRGAARPTRLRVAMAIDVAARTARRIPHRVRPGHGAERDLCARREMAGRIPCRGHDMTVATRVTPREMRGVRSGRRWVPVARIARRRAVLVTRQARRRGRFPGEVLAVAALACREVPTAADDFALMVRREARGVHALRRAIGTHRWLTLDGTTGKQHYDNEPLHRW